MPIKTIIDIGANSGQFAGYIRDIFPKAHIFCFEPLDEPFQTLQDWAADRENISLFNLALGEAEGVAEMNCHQDHDASSSLLPTTRTAESLYPITRRQKTVSVPIGTLDSVLHGEPTPIVPDVLIKLDVQGYEEHVIRGGEKTFSEARACFIEINVDRLYSGQAEFKELVCLLNDFGLQYIGNLDQAYGDDGHVIFFDAVFARS